MHSRVHLSETVVIDEVRSVSVDQSVEGETVLPAVGQKAEELSIRQRGAVGSSGCNLSTFKPLLVTLNELKPQTGHRRSQLDRNGKI